MTAENTSNTAEGFTQFKFHTVWYSRL